MNKLILIGVIVGLLSGCGDKDNYDWLEGDWSCDSYNIKYDKKLRELKRQDIAISATYRYENIDGQIYEIFNSDSKLFDTYMFSKPSDTYIFSELRKALSSSWKGGVYTTKSAIQIEDNAFIILSESENYNPFVNNSELFSKTLSQRLCKKINTD